MDRDVTRQTAVDAIDAALRRWEAQNEFKFDWETGLGHDWMGDDAVWVYVQFPDGEWPPVRVRDELRQCIWDAAGPVPSYTRFRLKSESE